MDWILVELDTGKHRMHDLGITTVYDLRSDTEILKYNTPTPCIDGVEIIHVPVFEKKDYSPEMMARYVSISRGHISSHFLHVCMAALLCLH